MSFRDIIDGKKQWRAHLARVKALPKDYQVVYGEIQSYFFKVGPLALTDGTLLSGLVDFFEQGVADQKGVRELLGDDIAGFADGLIEGAPTYADGLQAEVRKP